MTTMCPSCLEKKPLADLYPGSAWCRACVEAELTMQEFDAEDHRQAREIVVI